MPLHQGTTTNTSTADRSSASFAHDSGSQADRVLHVRTKTLTASGSISVSSITYNGVALTFIQGHSREYAAGRYIRVEDWYLVAPASGSNTLAVTYSGNARADEITVTTLYGVHQSDTVGAADVDDGNSNNPSVSLTTETADSWILYGACARGGDLNPSTPGSGLTELADGDTGTSISDDISYVDGYEETTTAGSYTTDSTFADVDQWVASAVEFKAASDVVLVVGDVTVSGVIDNVLLAGIDLSIQDVTVAETIDGVLLTGIDLAVEDTAVSGVIDGVLLTGIDLTVEDVIVAGTIEGVLLAGIDLVVEDVTVTGTMDNVALGGASLEVQDVTVAETIDSVLLTGIDLVIGDTAVSGNLDGVLLSGIDLVIQDVTVVETIDGVLLTGIDLAVEDTAVSGNIDPLLLGGVGLLIQDVTVAETIDGVLLTGIDLVVQDVTVVGVIDAVFLGSVADIEATRLRVLTETSRVVALTPETAVQVKNSLTRVG